MIRYEGKIVIKPQPGFIDTPLTHCLVGNQIAVLPEGKHYACNQLTGYRCLSPISHYTMTENICNLEF